MASDETDAEEPTDVASPGRDLRWRRRAVVLLVVLTSFGVLTSTVAFWTHRTLLNTDEWVATVGPVAADPSVQLATATFLTTQLMNVLDPEQLLTEALPPKVDFLATPLSTAFRDFVQETVLKLLQSEQFQRLWIAVNRYGHQAVVNFLRGDSRVVQAENGAVVVNLLPLVARALQAIQEKVPRLLEGKTIPDLTYDMPVEDQAAALSSALGRPLPENFAVFELLQSNRLASLQRAVIVFDRVVWVLIFTTLALAAASLLLSLRRLRTVVQLGSGVVIGMGLALGAIAAVKNQILELIVDPANRSAAASTLRALLGSFNDIARGLIAVGLVLVVGAFLLGDHRWAVAFRRLAVRGSGAAVSTASTVARGGEAPFPWIAKHRPELQLAGAAVAVLWLWLADVTWGVLLLVGLLLGAFELVVYLLSRNPAGEAVTEAATQAADASA